MKAAGTNRCGHRDATMVLAAFRHGLRAAELIDLRWEQVAFEAGHTARPQAQEGDACDASDRRARTAGAPSAPAGARISSPFVFISERGSPFTIAGFRSMIARAGETAGWASRSIPTCYATPPASRWPMRATIRDRCSPISGTGISSTRSSTLSWHQPAFATSSRNHSAP